MAMVNTPLMDDLLLSDSDWQNLMKMCDDTASPSDNIINQQQNTIHQKAIKNGNKIYVFNNCSGTFNF